MYSLNALSVALDGSTTRQRYKNIRNILPSCRRSVTYHYICCACTCQQILPYKTRSTCARSLTLDRSRFVSTGFLIQTSPSLICKSATVEFGDFFWPRARRPKNNTGTKTKFPINRSAVTPPDCKRTADNRRKLSELSDAIVTQKAHREVVQCVCELRVAFRN